VQKESKNKSQTTTNKWQTGKRPKKKIQFRKKNDCLLGAFIISLEWILLCTHSKHCW